MKREVGSIRVLLVDDVASIRHTLRNLLSEYPEIMVIGECTNGEDAVEAVSRLTPSVVIMDVNMPRLNGVEATALIKRNHPRVVVLGISIYATEIANQAMIKAGAEILISKGEIGEQLPYEIFKAMNRR